MVRVQRNPHRAGLLGQGIVVLNPPPLDRERRRALRGAVRWFRSLALVAVPLLAGWALGIGAALATCYLLDGPTFESRSISCITGAAGD